MRRILLALGGNALGDNPKEQEELTRRTSKTIVDLLEGGYEVIVTHGNGPQVGMINLGLEEYEIPLSECIAMSQGYIGYHLEKSIREELEKRNIEKEVSTIITQVLVDKDDEGFKNPSKPIGRFYNEDELKKVEEKFVIKKDSNRGYRRYVASPKPVDIIEKNTIEKLIDRGEVVIAGGGGGIPVTRKGKEYIGIDGVIDKDFTSELLAELLGVDIFIILTEVDKVCINFGKKDQEGLDRVNIEELERLKKEEQFAEGSMLPKIEASIKFIKSGKNKKAIITSIEKVDSALKEEDGTIIY